MEKILELLDARMSKIKDMLEVEVRDFLEAGNATGLGEAAKKLANYNAWDMQIRANLNKFYGDFYQKPEKED